MIRAIIVDVDGVLTDGKIYVDNTSGIQKGISLKDLDAVSLIKGESIIFGIITGEENFFTEYVKERFMPHYIYAGCKKKLEALKEIAFREKLLLEEICYIGDGKYDIECIQNVGVGICPSDAIKEVKDVSDICLENSAGKGCLAEAYTRILQINKRELNGRLKENIESGSTILGIEEIFHDHGAVLSKTVENTEINRAINLSIKEIESCFRHKGQLLLCGNGGSAADAQHIATEFVSRFYMDRKALNAEALNVNASSITAIANDYEYRYVFARQVEAKGKSGDVLMGITTSGTSQNVLEAFRAARRMDMVTVALCGANIDMLEDCVDIIISVPSSITPRIQEMHIMIGHMICECVEKDLFS